MPMPFPPSESNLPEPAASASSLSESPIVVNSDWIPPFSQGPPEPPPEPDSRLLEAPPARSAHASQSLNNKVNEPLPPRYYPIIAFMTRLGLPLTRENYLSIALPNRNLEAEPLMGEEFEMIPPEFWPSATPQPGATTPKPHRR